MTTNEFQQLIALAEDETLDFKQDGYDLERSRSALSKDVLAMANTPRGQSARIIFGVKWTPEQGSTVIGLRHQLDDDKLQNAFKRGKIQPAPRFIYTPLQFEGKQAGVLEIPLGNDGPYTPLVDFDGLQAGAVYYRRGTQNARAVGPELKRIFAWFHDRGIGIDVDSETHSWSQFLNGVQHFEQDAIYLLAVDRISTTTVAPISALGMPPWRAIIDFDPDSESSGFMSCVAATLGHRRVVHRVVKGQYQVQPEPGTHWFFARGLSGRQGTVVENSSHRTWLKTYKKELGRQLERLAGNSSPSPVVALVLWSEVSLRNHLRTLLEELHGAFGNAVEIVVVSSDAPSFKANVQDAGATFVQMSLRSLCNGVAVHYADLHSGDDERYILPSPSGAPVEVQAIDWLWLSEGLDLLHRSVGIDGDDDAQNYRLGADIAWRNLQLHHDCDRDITPMVRSQVEADLKKRLRLQGDSSMNTGMECGENVKARATTRFHWCTLPVTRDAAEAALLPSRSRKPGTGTGHRLAFQTGQGTKGKVCWLRRAATVQAPSPDSRRPSLGAASRYSPDAAVSRRALSRVNAVVPARRLTRAAAEARMRRGRWSRGRATS